MPTLAEYNAINSIGGASPQDLLSAANGTARLPIDPIALNYLKLFPAPNTGPAGQLANNFTISPNKTQFGNTYDARVDHRLDDRNLFFGRFSYNTVSTFTPPGLGTVNGLQISGGTIRLRWPSIRRGSAICVRLHAYLYASARAGPEGSVHAASIIFRFRLTMD